MSRLRYRKISVAIWNDEKFRESSAECKLVFLCVLTHPLMTSFGAMRGSAGLLKDELGIPEEGFLKGYREGLSKGFLKADPKACLIVVPKFLKHNPPDSPNVVRSWWTLMDNLPICPLLVEYLQQVKGYVEGYGEGYAKAFEEGYREGYALSPSSELLAPSSDQYPPADAGASSIKDSEAEKPAPPEKPKRKKSPPKALDENQLADFERFWTAYPKRENKPDAQKAWVQVAPPIDKVVAVLDEWQRAAFLDRGHTKYIPAPGPYIRGKRWEDERPSNTSAPTDPTGTSAFQRYQEQFKRGEF